MIELNPEYAKAYCSRGIVYGSRGQLDRAIDDFDQSIRYDSSNAQAYNNRGIAYASKGKRDLAFRDFNQAIELEPEYAQAYNNRGIAYTSEGELDLALRDLNQAIEFDTEYAQAYKNRGLVYSRKGDYAQAMDDFAQALKLNPGNAILHKTIGDSLRRLGHGEEAVKEYRRALELRTDWPEVLNELAWILATHEDAKVRDGAEAVRLATRACKLSDYRVPMALDTLAAAYAEVSQFELAVMAGEKATTLARNVGNENLASAIQGRLELYKNNRPYHK